MTGEVQVSSVEGVTVVCFKDLRLVIHEDRFEQVEQEVWEIVDQEPSTPLILDFENKELPTCHVVQQLFIRLHKRLGANFALCNLPPFAMLHFQVSHLAELLNIHAAREDALAAIK